MSHLGSNRRREPARGVAGRRARRGRTTSTPVGTDLTTWALPPRGEGMQQDVVLECGWGRLIFGNTFAEQRSMVDALRAEETGQRDICVYPPDPQVLVGLAPHELFVDPSYTYRLLLPDYVPAEEENPDVRVRPVTGEEDLEEVNRIYAVAQMVPSDVATMCANQQSRTFTYLVAEDARTGAVVGTVTGVDHVLAYGDPAEGASLWCLAVDPQTGVRGVGEALTRAIAEHYASRGRAYLDLTVLHHNTPAIALYEKIGFVRVPLVCVKRKNPINRPLFSPAPPELSELNPYARLIADEALRRGITVEVTDGPWGEMRLSHGGRTVLTRESLSELTSAVAMSRCDDKRVTRRIVEAAGGTVARGRETDPDGPTPDDVAFLHEIGELVVKPARGEQGRGITVGVRDEASLRAAVELAARYCPDILLEECVEGQDLRVVVIDGQVVAAAVRVPATVVGNDRDTIEDLIAEQSARRERATGGESSIPLDGTTVQVVEEAGHALDEVLPAGDELQVRRTANLHTGGTIQDVTDRLHPELARVAVAAARAIGIPVTGIDLLVPDVEGPRHVFVEANERPGLANHEPQPTAQRFVDLLFPETRRQR
jgi:GNAT-family acetyltransferase (TIGR03103 family)